MQFIIVERWLARGQPGGAGVHTGRRSGGAQLASVGIGYHFLPTVLVGVRLRLAQPCFGSTIALRRETLAAIGGFDACVDCVADDYAIRQSVRAEGTKVAIPSLVLAHSCTERSFALQLGPEFRRGPTLRVVYAPGYAGVIVTHPLAFAAIGAPPGDVEAAAIAMTEAAIGCRLVLQLQVDHTLRARRNRRWLGPARDPSAFAVDTTRCLVDVASWHGRRAPVGTDTLVPVVEPNA